MWVSQSWVGEVSRLKMIYAIMPKKWNTVETSTGTERERSVLRFRGLDTVPYSPPWEFLPHPLPPSLSHESHPFPSLSVCLNLSRNTGGPPQRRALTNIYSVIHSISHHLSPYLLHSQRKWELMLVMSLKYRPDRQAPQ